jgi:hypothetical protein
MERPRAAAPSALPVNYDLAAERLFMTGFSRKQRPALPQGDDMFDVMLRRPGRQGSRRRRRDDVKIGILQNRNLAAGTLQPEPCKSRGW